MNKSIALIIIIIYFLVLLHIRGARLRYVFVDVSVDNQQGLANLFIYEEHKRRVVVLVDSGSQYTAQHLVDVLHDNNISAIDYVLITHYHYDHIGGLSALFSNNIKIKNFYYNKTADEINKKNKKDYKEFLDLVDNLRNNGTNIYNYPDDWRLDFGKYFYVELVYKHDGVTEPIGPTTLNDTGVVLKFIFKKRSEKTFLITGDIGEVASQYILDHKKQAIEDIDILQVPHHAATPTAVNGFVGVINPDIALVPAYESLWDGPRCHNMRQELDALDTKIYVSDLDGDVVFNF